MAPSNNRNPNTNQPPINNNQPPPANDQPPPNIIDINSPNYSLYLHPNDHPGLILISKKLVGSENYSSWKRSMMIALNAKNKLKIVTGEMIEPTIDSEERALWERTNDMIISWILNTISDQISNNLNFVNSASALWNEFIEVYYHKLKGLWDEHDALEATYLCNCASSYENGKNNGDREQRKRLIQEGHSADECYNLKGYPISHPLHGKYKPLVTRNVNVNDNMDPKVNLVHGNDTASTSYQAEAITSGNDAVFGLNKRIAHGNLCEGLYIIYPDEAVGSFTE
ncbi:cysteine-rich receptor-like protein kinase 8 [Tanacetum coccineum]